MKLQWETRKFIASGTEGIVLKVKNEVGEWVAVKIAPPQGQTGCITTVAVKRQRLLARFGLSVPVHMFRSRMYIPKDVRVDLCREHSTLRYRKQGKSPGFGSSYDMYSECTCHQAEGTARKDYFKFASVLVMDMLERDGNYSQKFEAEVSLAIDVLNSEIRKLCNFVWGDSGTYNVGFYNGRWVAIDLGR